MEAQQPLDDAFVAHAEAQALASQMIAGNSVDLSKLQEKVSGGAFLWVWVEDADRHAAHPEGLRKFSHANWANLEAHWLLLQAGGGNKYRSGLLGCWDQAFPCAHGV